MTFSSQYLKDVSTLVDELNVDRIEEMVTAICEVRDRGGRIFFLGVGGSAANASHAVNDFRKIAGIECYAPTDNTSELTARTNDEGWDTIFSEWLAGSRLNKNDAIFILSVGGGSLERNVSPNLVKAIQFAKSVDATIMGIVSRDGGYTAKEGDVVLLIPVVNAEAITPLAESFQAVVWHLLVSHPAIKAKQTKWESEKIAV